jgi:D-sedoheptulose 7-phosphate isomerase
MDYDDILKASFDGHQKAFDTVRTQLGESIVAIGKTLCEVLHAGGKILLCGNGGSAADSQHIAAELTGRYLIADRRALPAIALTTDTSALTAIGNDFGFDHIFSRQVSALACKGDAVIGISTSGQSANILRAFDKAKSMGCRTIALSGRDGGAMVGRADYSIVIPSNHTPHIQEMHILVGHVLCDIIDRHFAS